MLRHVPLVRADVSEEISASIIRVTRIGELGTTLAVTSNGRTLGVSVSPMRYELGFYIPEDGFLLRHRPENMKSIRSVCRLLVTANVVPSSAILIAQMIEALDSYETSVLTRATRR
jgi:hypothetical protein